MKDENIDWLVYHLLIPQEAASPEDLATRSDLDLITVTRSLQRLEKYLLIEMIDGRARVLSFAKSLIRSQVRYEADFPYTIENGVITPKKKD